jgi:hypothetical protein
VLGVGDGADGVGDLAWRRMIHLSRPLYIGSTLCLNHCFDKIVPVVIQVLFPKCFLDENLDPSLVV